MKRVYITQLFGDGLATLALCSVMGFTLHLNGTLDGEYRPGVHVSSPKAPNTWFPISTARAAVNDIELISKACEKAGVCLVPAVSGGWTASIYARRICCHAPRMVDAIWQALVWNHIGQEYVEVPDAA